MRGGLRKKTAVGIDGLPHTPANLGDREEKEKTVIWPWTAAVLSERLNAVSEYLFRNEVYALDVSYSLAA